MYNAKAALLAVVLEKQLEETSNNSMANALADAKNKYRMRAHQRALIAATSAASSSGGVVLTASAILSGTNAKAVAHSDYYPDGPVPAAAFSPYGGEQSTFWSTIMLALFLVIITIVIIGFKKYDLQKFVVKASRRP